LWNHLPKTIVERITHTSERRILHESAANFYRLQNTLTSFREEVLPGFSALGDSLLEVTAQAALGNAQMKNSLTDLRTALDQQRQSGAIDTGALLRRSLLRQQRIIMIYC
jgi:hypothetical protein